MSGILSMVFGLAILIAGLIAGFVLLWLAFGRGGKNGDKAVGILEAMSFFKGATSSTNNRMR